MGLRHFLLPPACLIFAAACGPGIPEPGTEAYLEAAGAFYSGVAAIEIGDDLRARARLERVTELAPTEQAAWANLALLAMRRGETGAAVAAADEALAAGTATPHVSRIAALAHAAARDSARANAILESVAELDVRTLVLKTELLPASRRTVEGPSLLTQAAHLAPENRALSFRLARVAAGTGDAAAVRSWAETEIEDAAEPLAGALEAILQADAEALPLLVGRAGNILVRNARYRDDLNAIATPPEMVEEPVFHPTALPPSGSRVAAADRDLLFRAEPLPVDAGGWSWSGAIHLADDPLASVVLAREGVLNFRDGGTATLTTTSGDSPPAVAIQDLDQDYLADIAVAGSGGVEVLYQNANGTFAHRQGSVPEVGSARWIQAVDYDLEGDLDLVVGLERGFMVLQNRGDGQFESAARVGDTQISTFIWGDLDNDGDPDVVLQDTEGSLHYLDNLRNGRWGDPRVVAQGIQRVGLADLDRDGTFDLAALGSDGAPRALSHTPNGLFGESVIAIDAPIQVSEPTGLFLTDVDNNGALDWIITSGQATQVLLTDSDGGLATLPTIRDFETDAVATLSDAGAPELIGRNQEGDALFYFPESLAAYNWKRIRPQAAQVLGDRRINTFAVGGEVELRSGLLYQKQPITGQVLHFGLGDNQLTDVARIVWPNGDVQVEFDLLSDETILAQQRLKGSCPWLFTFDGQEMQFATDFLWRSPLGLRINAVETAGIATTADWVRIPGDQLKSVGGHYELRITAELWESHFFDQVSLLVVDHPADSEVFVDERFAFPPPSDARHLFGALEPFESILDAAGEDAADKAAHLDGDYVAGFEKGPYQGIASEHTIEMALPSHAGRTATLIASGWVRPTDSSINVALGQTAGSGPQSLKIEIPDASGGWVTARTDLGFPSGKNKTVLIDLQDLWPEGGERRLRLRTNLEIYWDRLAWAERSEEVVVEQEARLLAADLQYRGFSRVSAKDGRSPELPEYDVLESTSPIWRDLVGYHTRFGDVRELVEAVDDRYVIMNAGDEMVFRFEAPPPPAEGWERDFVLLGDGWVKDGDLNTTYSTGLLPLPTHRSAAYDVAPSGLENDPVYLAHPEDWDTYHTRYVTPDRYRRAAANSG